MPRIFIMGSGAVVKVEHKQKIATLVALQISLIVASFLIIVYLESQTSHTGNVVNVAGKNRILTSQVHVELNRVLIVDPPSEIHVLEALERLEANIMFLKHGGDVDEVVIFPLASQFDGDWNDIWNSFESYKAKVLNLVRDRGMLEKSMADIDEVSTTLVNLSDMLTSRLSDDSERLTVQIIIVQITLAIVNVVAHILMIILIWRIFNRYAEQRAMREKFAILGEFAATIAHDMRNPLGAIRNSMILIQGSSDGREVSAETQRVSRAVKRMSHQIEGVLNYVRNVPLILEPASIMEIMEQSIDNVQIPDTITVATPKEDATIPCDAEKLEFVFTNILLNATQTLGSKRGRIVVRLDDRKDAVVLSFENSGTNIAADNMPKIFEPLFTTKMQGTGLGLTSCKNIIERHGGTITASNDPVTFTIQLPK